MGHIGVAETVLADRSVSAPNSEVVEPQIVVPRRVVIVCSRLFREALKQLLASLSVGFEDGAATVADTMPGVSDLNAPDLVICVALGEEMRQATFADILRARQRLPGIRWLVLTDAVTPWGLRGAAMAGVDGLLLHDISGKVLLHAAELLLLGQTLLPSLMLEAADEPTCLPARAPTPPETARRQAIATEMLIPPAHGMPQLPRLSDRERQILDCLVRGFSNKVIARQLNIADATVKVHVKGLLRKLQVANRTQAAILALDLGALGGAAAEIVGLPRVPPARLAAAEVIAPAA